MGGSLCLRVFVGMFLLVFLGCCSGCIRGLGRCMGLWSWIGRGMGWDMWNIWGRGGGWVG